METKLFLAHLLSTQVQIHNQENVMNIPDKIQWVNIPQSQFLQNMKFLVNNSLYSDLKIFCENSVFHAHKAILAIRMENFIGNFLNSKDQEELHLDYSAEIFEKLLEFLYTGFIAYSDEVGIKQEFSKFVKRFQIQTTGNFFVGTVTEPIDWRKLLTADTFSDITIIVEGKPIKAHRAVLAARSEYFHAQLSFVEKAGDSELTVNEISFDGFLKILEFFHTDSIEITGENVVELLAYSTLILLERVRALCERYLLQNVNVENVIPLLRVAKEYQANALYSHCIMFLQEHYRESMAKSKMYPEDVAIVTEDIQTYCTL